MKPVIYGALAVGAILAYRHYANRILIADFNGYEISTKQGKVSVKSLKTGAVVDGLPDLATAQKWVNDNKPSALVGWIPGIGDDLMLPPTGRTVTASGDVLNGLGYNIDSYDANPSQYRRDVVNDMMPMGGWLKKAVKKVANVATKVTKTALAVPIAATKVGVAVVSQAGKIAEKPTLKNVVGLVARPVNVVANTAKNIAKSAISPIILLSPASGKKLQSTESAPAAEPVAINLVETYKGYTIWTAPKETGGVVYLVNYVAAANTAEASFATLVDARNAIDAVTAPPAGIAPPTPPVSTYDATKAALAAEQAEVWADTGKMFSVLINGNNASWRLWEHKLLGIYKWTGRNPNATVQTNDYRITDRYVPPAGGSVAESLSNAAAWGKQFASTAPVSTYDATKAAAEQASMSQASSDSGYGPTQTVTEEGSPALPETVASIQTPSATVDPGYNPPPASASAPSGDSKVGIVVGGGILAALAAAALSK